APKLQYQRDDLALRRDPRISLAGFHLRAGRRHRRRNLCRNRRRHIATADRSRSSAESFPQDRRLGGTIIAADRKAWEPHRTSLMSKAPANYFPLETVWLNRTIGWSSRANARDLGFLATLEMTPEINRHTIFDISRGSRGDGSA